MRTLWRMDRYLCRCRARLTDCGLLGIFAPSSMLRSTPRGDTGILTCPSPFPPVHLSTGLRSSRRYRTVYRTSLPDKPRGSI